MSVCAQRRLTTTNRLGAMSNLHQCGARAEKVGTARQVRRGRRGDNGLFTRKSQVVWYSPLQV
jgi:hypothetical protein